MGDYDLQRLNPRDFQHMVQAIARKHIAAGVTAFGDGKDGGRDLIYRGKMDYPSLSAPWNGYLILGCKFNQRPSGNRKKDGAWAKQQLEADLRKFVDRRRNLSKPEYYLFVTNITLTGTAGTGGRDQVTKLMEDYKQKLRLRDYGVWDYNDLRSFIDGDSDLRESYGAFITPGDVLQKMTDFLKPKNSDFLTVMHSYVQKELIADTSAKLQSAGEDPEVQIPLANVFVDLPYAESAEDATFARRDQPGREPTVISRLLEAGSFVLRSPGQDEVVTSSAREWSMNAPPSRFVIVGGPGQGKSTLGQYLCQLYRASILKDRPTRRLDQHAIKIIKQLDTQTAEVGGLPSVRRFPLRLELKTFSQALANEPQLTLAEYIRRELERFGGAAVLIADVMGWLEKYPWLVVLDGLDEVPPSSNRSDVMKQIEDFRIDAATRNADLMLVATTRPQSYSKEFPDDLFTHLYLVPLEPRHALQYAVKLAEARYISDDRRKDEVIRSLQKACGNPSTARLMQSPLQVTIMATLLEETGDPPQQRYRLFFEYYRTIYKRETRRNLLGGILSERQKDIDTIHAHAGLLLHAVGEKANRPSITTKHQDSEAALSDDQFRELVRRRLTQINVTTDKLNELLKKISDGSLQRLVFLVRPRDGWIRFDIASLKEFMAAEALMIGPDGDLQQRLETIAPATYWRNVCLFAVGKCFLEREYLLDTVVSLCVGLNEEKVAAQIFRDELSGRVSKATHWGSRLALDILMDGTARQHPKYERRFFAIALELITTADPETCARLASVYYEDLEDLYRAEVQDRFGQSRFHSKLGAWHLTISLADRGVSWAAEIRDRYWPSDVRQQQMLLMSYGHLTSNDWFLRRVLDITPKVPPMWVARLVFDQRRFIHWERSRHNVGQRNPLMETLRSFVEPVLRGVGSIEVQCRSRLSKIINTFDCGPVRINSPFSKTIKDVKFEDKNWFPTVSGVRFGQLPNANSLAKELRWLAEQCDSPINFANRFLGRRGSFLPWPLEACLQTANSKEDLIQMARSAESGALGDARDWEQAQVRWLTNGVRDEDVSAMTDDRWPYGPDISKRGFPFFASAVSTASLQKSEIKVWLELLNQLPGQKSRAWLASVMLESFSQSLFSLYQSGLTAKQIKEIFSLATNFKRRRWISLDGFGQRPNTEKLDAEWLELLDWLGRQDYSFHASQELLFGDQLIHHLYTDPDRWTGLLPIIIMVASRTGQNQVPGQVLDNIRRSNQSLAEDAILLTLAAPRNDMLKHELTDLANELWGIENRKYTFSRVLRITGNIAPARAAAFALELCTIGSPSSESETENLQEAHQSLIEYLTKRSSNLDEPGLWEKLHLPNLA